jgi:hypothetical protein
LAFGVPNRGTKSFSGRDKAAFDNPGSGILNEPFVLIVGSEFLYLDDTPPAADSNA